MTPHDVIIKTPVSMCVQEGVYACTNNDLMLAWQLSQQTSLSLLPVLSLCYSKKTLYKVLKGPLGNDHIEKLHILLGPTVL